ncbi:hypothetical protein EXIGLDRAFT_695742 [Exidia glandulosa HHB12029]|uniref:Uncharacterized protein n=1 Tax=Exidia glandulosa HHB12029 TaxID=1314781 RepID=A0A165FN83_EXIGL|nr:hypothetical protein EXIGLDRAFT_695742 [Exidia glandulosa HHB12029]
MSSHVNRLPVEIRSLVFSELSTAELDRTQRAVCKLWKVEIEDSPSLSRTVCNVQPNRLNDVLRRSRNLLITVTLHCNTPEELALASAALSPQMSRVIALDFSVNFSRWPGSDNESIGHLLTLLSKPAPKLERLELALGFFVDPFNVQIFSGIAPNLVFVDVIGIDFAVRQEAFSRVKILTAWAAREWPAPDGTAGQWEVFTHIQHIASHFPSLRTLKLIDFPGASDIFRPGNILPPNVRDLELTFDPMETIESAAQTFRALNTARWHQLSRLRLNEVPGGRMQLLLAAVTVAGVHLTSDERRVIRFVTDRGVRLEFAKPWIADLEALVAPESTALASATRLDIGAKALYYFELPFIHRLARHCNFRTVLLPVGLSKCSGPTIFPRWMEGTQNAVVQGMRTGRLQFKALQHLLLSGPEDIILTFNAVKGLACVLDTEQLWDGREDWGGLDVRLCGVSIYEDVRTGMLHSALFRTLVRQKEREDDDPI